MLKRSVTDKRSELTPQKQFNRPANTVDIARRAGGFYFSDDIYGTLELEDLLKVYFTELSDAISCDGMRYSKASHSIDHLLGKQSQQVCELLVRYAGADLGRLQFFREEPFSSYEITAMAALRDQFAMPLRNALQYTEARIAAQTDYLTGVGNRSALASMLGRELQVLHRYPQSTALLMIDIDDFKSVNDVYGHIIGDNTLKVVTDCIRECVRETDELFRPGGDEFVAVLRNTEKEGALRIAERIRYLVADKRLLCPDDYFCLSVSIGVTLLSCDDSQQAAIERADKGLYAAKTNGKNQICFLTKDA